MPAAASDHENYDRARDELAVPDPFDPIFEPAYTHGLVTVADSFSATQASDPLTAGSYPADARATTLLPSRGLTGLSDL